MTWNTWKPTFALGAVLAVSGAASADDRDTPRLAGGSSTTTMTLGGRGTVQQAATEDTELARGYRGGYGYHSGYGYRGGYGGYRGGYYGGYGGYRGGYYGGYYGGYRGGYYNNFYRPSYYYPSYYYPSYYYPSYYSYPNYYGGGGGIYIGISGGAGSGAPTLALGSGLTSPVGQPAAQPMAPPATPNGDGTFRYDGGPANPVPLPKAEPKAIPPANPSSSLDVPVSLKPKTTTSPYKYKAYGEK